jgi:CHAT domain-containing protein
MLIATSEPNGLELPAAKREAERIQVDLRGLVEAGRLSIDLLAHATPASLHHKLVTGRYDIVHFIGHGYWRGGVSGLVLEDRNQGPFELDERNLREMFAGRGLRVVFLNACDTARGVNPGGRPYSIGGTAQSLFGRGIPVVVANQLKVRDGAAADFASQFYRYLAHGLSIAEATREARIAASYFERRESIDWAIPVVYARNAGGALVQA